MELEKIFESILREGWDEDLAAYNKASSRFDRQKRSIYGLASNEMNRLDKADGTTVTLDCGGSAAAKLKATNEITYRKQLEAAEAEKMHKDSQ